MRTAATPLFATTLAKCLRSRPKSSVKDRRIRSYGEPEAQEGWRRAGRRHVRLAVGGQQTQVGQGGKVVENSRAWQERGQGVVREEAVCLTDEAIAGSRIQEAAVPRSETVCSRKVWTGRSEEDIVGNKKERRRRE